MTRETLTQLIGIGIPTLRELRAGVLAGGDASDGGAEPVRLLREAGFAGGDAVYEAFQRWLGESRPSGADPAAAAVDISEVSLSEFGESASRFFRDAGWGDMTFAAREDDGVAVVTISDCWETSDGQAGEMPGCHLTTGMLAAFFGRVAGYPVAVLETECSGSGGSRCSFTMGNADVVNYEWERLR
ncbi:MAG: 4-vinyl reductase [Acidobacteriota bacterium]|nr:hypothetical protein [Gemmatimonadaceae bacterium]MDQ3135855.1 4-vinyl reductase [Acidobacteriota bacterium]